MLEEGSTKSAYSYEFNEIDIAEVLITLFVKN